MGEFNLVSRNLVDQDFEHLISWWEWWGFPVPSKNFLPDNGLSGLIVDLDNLNISYNIPVCAGFCYSTNSDLCWIEFVVSNPSVKDKDIRQQSFNKLINDLCDYAKVKGHLYAFTSCKVESLINHYIDCDFNIGDKKMTNLIKKL